MCTELLRKLRWAMGRKHSNFSWRGKESEVLDYLYNIENDMLILVNFLYTLYTGNLKADDTEYNLFKPYVELLQGYGNTFEEVVSTIIRSFGIILHRKTRITLSLQEVWKGGWKLPTFMYFRVFSVLF
jgi:hypothetical protein